MLHGSEKILIQHGLYFPYTMLCCGGGFFITLIIENILGPIIKKRHNLPSSSFSFFDPDLIENEKTQEEDNLVQKENFNKDHQLSETSEDNKDPPKNMPEKPKNEKTEILSSGAEEFQPDPEVFLKQETISFRIISIVLFITLSFHGFLEGLALGVATNFHQALGIGIAIIAHKWIGAFAIGTSLIRAYRSNRKTVILYLIIFGTASPIGIITGIAIYNYNSPVICSFFVALASGTFLFAASYEFKNVIDGEKPTQKIGFGILGFTLMTVVAIFN
eukprot:Anaeramoba_ignava/c17726_g1_i2.p1 GENE.c17726_g1_i2~~c17726_g1_i2.p1  ORF type:complete len:275 (+),score=88.20 c17726_g1_i2:392-1216(+)